MTTRGEIIYRVDDRDDIVFVNEEWDRFAEANAGEGITSSHVLKRPLWDFIVDLTTRELYRQVMKRIRDGSSVRFSLRCDSPTCRRLLAMEVARREDGTVEFRTRTLSEETRNPVPLPTASAACSDELLRVCGWCKKVFADGAWEEVEVAIDRLKLFHRDIPPSVTHGICERCYQDMRATLNLS